MTKIKAQTNCPTMLMLKANAYGFGCEKVAVCMQDMVDMFGVATIDEANAVRRCGVQNDILVMECAPNEIANAIRNGFYISLNNFAQLNRLIELIECGDILASDVRIHLKVDSGMHRLGFDSCQMDSALDALKSRNIDVKGVFSHLRDVSYEQARAFDKMSNAVRLRYPNVIRHLSSSHALHLGSMRYDMVRVGLYAYRGAMHVKSKVLSSRIVERGESVSYGSYTTKERTCIATVFGGYADGIGWLKYVYINGKRCDVVGNICMDTFIVDCHDFLPKTDDDVDIFDGDCVLDLERCTGMSEYQLYTSFCGRVERIYKSEL